ncbi:MAG: hypothetical protein JW931_06230 [Methanomicrobiaceae archaeon]|nr:hypothetical protein [Methanomicrobiaceae archaeon]
MKLKKNILIPCIAAGVLTGLVVSLIIAGSYGQAGEAGDVIVPALFEISGHTEISEAEIALDSEVLKTLEAEYGPLNIPRTVRRFDIVQFYTPEDEDLGVLIRGKEYTLLLEKMNFESIDDGINSYSGRVGGFEDSVVLLTFSGNIVTGSIEFAGETIFISPVQNRENAEKTVMPLHIVYTSKNMDQPGLFGGF